MIFTYSICSSYHRKIWKNVENEAAEHTRDEEEYKIFDIRLGFFCDYFIFLLEYRSLKMFLHSYDFTLEQKIYILYMQVCDILFSP